MGDDKKTITIDLAEYERQQAQTQEALARIVQLEGAMVAAGTFTHGAWAVRALADAS